MSTMDTIWITYASRIKDFVVGPFAPELKFLPNGFAETLPAHLCEEEVNEMYWNLVNNKAVSDLALGAPNASYFDTYFRLLNELYNRTLTNAEPDQKASLAAALKAVVDASKAWSAVRSRYSQTNKDFQDWANANNKNKDSQMAHLQWLQTANPVTKNILLELNTKRNYLTSLQNAQTDSRAKRILNAWLKCQQAFDGSGDSSLTMATASSGIRPKYSSQLRKELLSQPAGQISLTLTRQDESAEYNVLNWDAKTEIAHPFTSFFSLQRDAVAEASVEFSNKNRENWSLRFSGALRRLVVEPGVWHDNSILNLAASHHLSLKHPFSNSNETSGVAGRVDSLILATDVRLDMETSDPAFIAAIGHWKLHQELGLQLGPFVLGGSNINVLTSQQRVEVQSDKAQILISIDSGVVALGFLYKTTFIGAVD
jgi:hypothetical protein